MIKTISILGFFIGIAILIPLYFIPTASAGERCSPLSGRCFEWPLVPDGTTLEKISTDGIWKKPNGNGPFPAVIIAESCGGSTPAVDQMWPSFFNELGYATYTPRVLGQFGEKYCPSLRFVASNTNRAKMLGVLYSALDELANKDFIKNDSIGIIGFSLGGILIRDAGEVRNLKSPQGRQFKYAINVYGNCTLLERKGDNIPTLFILAEKDVAKGKRNSCLKVQDQGFNNLSFYDIKNAYHGFDDRTKTSLKKDVAGNEMLFSEAATTEAKKVIKKFLESSNLH